MKDKKELYEEFVLPDGTRTNLIHEVSMNVRIDGESVGTVSCTPCDLRHFVVGWAISEGMIESATDIGSMHIDEANDSCDLVLAGPVTKDDDAGGSCDRVPMCLSRETFSEICTMFMDDPPLRAMTNATHSCMVVHIEKDKNPEILYRSEDAGRHSALDKAIGWMALNEVDAGDCLLMTSGRISTRMAEKASRSGAGALAGKGTVTADAREIAEKTGMTLIGMIDSGKACWFVGSSVKTEWAVERKL